MDKHLHIISFDVPLPADYGGVIDVYYRLKALHELGIKIHLHCFTKGRDQAPALEKYCLSVNYYQRKSNLNGFSFDLPYIVRSRSSAALLHELAKDSHPILAENLHCSYFLYRGLFPGRKIFIRQQNVEHAYYDALAKNESNFLKKFYFKNEARLLKKYEMLIANKAAFWHISSADADVYKHLLHADNVHFLPAFLAQDEVASKAGSGAYCLYHGNLSVNENERAAAWLIENVYSTIKIPFVIAGYSPSKKLTALAAKYEHISIEANPAESKMLSLVQNAAVNVLPSFNSTGVKLKLFNALFNGRHCLTNAAGIEGAELNDLCNIAETAAEFREQIQFLFAKPFTEKAMQHRSAALKDIYNNEANARRISAWIW